MTMESNNNPSPSGHVKGTAPHEIGRQIMERIAKIHPWKELCVSDIAQSITSEREVVALREAQLRYISTQWPETSAGKYARAALAGETTPHWATKGPLFEIDTDRAGKEPCGECHIQPGETCDICGASNLTPAPNTEGQS